MRARLPPLADSVGRVGLLAEPPRGGRCAPDSQKWLSHLARLQLAGTRPSFLRGKGSAPPYNRSGELLQRDVRILTHLSAIARRAAQEFVQSATSPISESDPFRISL